MTPLLEAVLSSVTTTEPPDTAEAPLGRASNAM